ncbi:metallophosphoesterase [Psychrobacillus sp. NPDC093180]|uniref:metallophosphoesterase n=1 Tax=Psychrobacillus sp. NPDC093180 TaxID=3364489 RepID=UPI0037F5D968
MKRTLINLAFILILINNMLNSQNIGYVEAAESENNTSVSEQPYIVLEDFETNNSWKATGDRFKTIAATISTDTVRFGENALRLDYDFLGQLGTSGIYASKDARIDVPGNPDKIGMWIYGDGNKHWLRQQMYDANGQSFNIDFTSDYPNGVTWKGWKYVEASIPDTWVAPFQIGQAIRYMATKDEGKSAGTIYVDNIQAVYGEFDEDVTNPTLANFNPSDTSTTNKPEISITATDNVNGSGLDANKIYMKIDGKDVIPTFNPEIGIISYKSITPLVDGLHEVYVEVYDNEGNHTFETFSLTISSGGPEFNWAGPAVSLAGATFEVQLTIDNIKGLSGTDLKLGYDPLLMTFQDGDQTIEGLQVKLEDKFKNTAIINQVDEETGQILLKLEGLNAIETNDDEILGTVSFSLGNNASGTTKLALLDGSLTFEDTTIGTLPFLTNPFESAIKQPYVLTLEGKSVGTITKLTVKDLEGNPVEGAKISITNGTKLLKIVNDTTIYKGGSGVQGEPYQTVTAGAYMPFTNAPTATFGFYRVYIPNGQVRYYHVPSGDAEVTDWNSLFDLSDENGEIITDKLTLSQIPLSIQAEKDGLVSQVESFTITPQLGTHKPENITLTWTQDPKTSQHFTWRTATAHTNSIVEVVANNDEKGFGSDSVIRTNGASELYADSNTEMMIHKTAVNELTPGTEYQYRVGDGTEEGWSEIGIFRTEVNDEEPFNFLFFTDTQSQDAAGFVLWTKLFELGLEKYPDTKFALHSGDIVEDGSVMSQWELFLQASKGLSQKIPFMSVLGNHDVYGNGESIYNSLFAYPQNGPEGKKGFVYSFDYGNATFLMLNSEFGVQDMEQQQQWIRQEVEKSNKEWIIAMYHRPAYKSNPLTGVNATATTFAPLLEELNVDLVLNGHDHSYMRTHAMKGGKVQTDGEGTVYVIGGSAGPKFYPTEVSDYVDVQFDTDTQIFTSISIEGNKLKGKVFTIDNELVDSFEMQKTSIEEPEQIKPEKLFNIKKLITNKLTITKPNVSVSLADQSVITEEILFTGSSYAEFQGAGFEKTTVILKPSEADTIIDFKDTKVRKVIINGNNVKEIRGADNIQEIEYINGAELLN